LSVVGRAGSRALPYPRRWLIKNVYTDVTGLVELGLMDRDDDGTLSTPLDQIIIHAGIRDAA
jgi:hypothetical protein